VRKMIVKCEDCHKPIDTEKDEYVRRHVYREGKYTNTPVPGESEYQHLECHDEGLYPYD
jgi:hypothetical protein